MSIYAIYRGMFLSDQLVIQADRDLTSVAKIRHRNKIHISEDGSMAYFTPGACIDSIRARVIMEENFRNMLANYSETRERLGKRLAVTEAMSVFPLVESFLQANDNGIWYLATRKGVFVIVMSRSDDAKAPYSLTIEPYADDLDNPLFLSGGTDVAMAAFHFFRNKNIFNPRIYVSDPSGARYLTADMVEEVKNSDDDTFCAVVAAMVCCCRTRRLCGGTIECVKFSDLTAVLPEQYKDSEETLCSEE